MREANDKRRGAEGDVTRMNLKWEREGKSEGLGNSQPHGGTNRLSVKAEESSRRRS